MSKDFFTEVDCDLGFGPKEARSFALSLDKANRLLRERGKVVYGSFAEDGNIAGFVPTEEKHPRDTHTALLIDIQPIEQADSAEKVRQAFVNCCDVDDPKLRWGELRARAKAILAKEEA